MHRCSDNNIGKHRNYCASFPGDLIRHGLNIGFLYLDLAHSQAGLPHFMLDSIVWVTGALCEPFMSSWLTLLLLQCIRCHWCDRFSFRCKLSYHVPIAYWMKRLFSPSSGNYCSMYFRVGSE